ncbi:MAG: hypothetical protein KAY46_18885 [Burkholderiaceae bacterium]|nr:hypothetical protein [Burkholderiaceae bacterium]
MSARTRLLGLTLAAGLALTAPPTLAVLVTDAPPGSRETQFHQRLSAALSELAKSRDPLLRELLAAVKASPGRIVVRPLTDDPATWSSDGDRDRAHTEPADRRPKRIGRSAPTDAIVFLNRDAVDEGSSHWRGGVLVHELTHALDLSTGRYNADVRVRERRAVFMQNVWRQRVGYPLRASYHGRFATLDYQVASKHGEIAEFGRYLFTGPDFPVDRPR